MKLRPTHSIEKFAKIAKKRRLYFVVVDNKGGVLKSAIAATIKALLDRVGITALLISTDQSNNDMGQYGDAISVDVRNKQHGGKIGFAANQLIANEHEAVILDVAAGNETQVNAQLPRTASDLADNDCCMVVVRPITLNPFNQANAVNFVNTGMTDAMAVVLVRVLCQGREAADYLEWDDSDERTTAMDKGAIETDYLDASAKFADMANAFGLTFYDITMGHFNQSDHPDLARASFEGHPQIFLRDWCELQHELFAAAFLSAIDRKGVVS